MDATSGSSGSTDHISPFDEGRLNAVTETGVLKTAGSLDAEQYTSLTAEEVAMKKRFDAANADKNRLRLVKFGVLGLLLLVGLGLVGLRQFQGVKNNQTLADASVRYKNISVPLATIPNNTPDLTVQNAQTLSINGQLNVNNSLVFAPGARPTKAITGQLYFDQTTKELSYYNGTNFIALTQDVPAPQGVTAVGGATGAVSLGGGLGVNAGTLANTGVLTLQGQAGNVTLTAGAGMVISGTTLSNSGLLSLAGQTGAITLGSGLGISGNQLSNTGIISAVGSGMITVTNDGFGNITIDGPNSSGGSGTVASPGGTSGKIAKFTGVQTIADSLLSDNGTAITVGGDLSVTGTVTLTNPLAVTSGGTGSATAAGARTNLGAAKSGANGDITAITGLTTALSVAQGGTGIGTLATNGVIVGNGTSALTSVVAGGAGQCLLSTAGAPAWTACPGGGAVMSLNGGSGALTLNNASLSGSNITIDNATTAAKGIASFNSTNFSVTSGAVNTIQNINTTATPTFGQLTLTSSQASNPMLLVNNTNLAASGALLDLQLNGSSKFSVTPAGNVTSSGTLNGQTISATANFTGSVTVGTTLAVNTITPSSSLTVGSSSQSYTLQGNASSSFTITSGANTMTYSFATPASTASATICTTLGNCAGVGGGVTTSGGSTNKLAKFTAGTTIGDSIITDNGTTVTVGGTLSVNTITPTGALTVGATGQNLTLQGATVSLSATASGTTNSLVFTTPSGGNKTITLPNASGTVAVSTSGPLALDASGNLTCPTCLTSGGGGGSAGVSSVNSLTGALTLQGSSAGSVTNGGATITINDASSTIKGLASFNATNLTVTSGAVNTVQDIAVTSTPTFAGLSLTAALTVGNGGTGSATAAGARTNLGAAKSGANSDITSLSGLTTALSVAQGGTGIATTPTNGQILIGNGTNYSLNTLSAGSGVSITNGAGTITISAPGSGTCSGCADTALSNLASVAINTTLKPGTAGGADLGTATLPFGQLFISGTSASPAVNNFKLTGASTSGTRTITLPDADGTVAVSASGNIALSATGNITFTGTLGVTNGGTGASTLTTNGILVGNGTSAISAITGSAGQCLLATAGAPAFGTCPGSGGVTSVNSQTGVVAIANTTASSGTITIDDASAASKGIASFNSTNFSVSSGAVNTVQNINNTATPTFGSLTLGNATSLTLGSASSATGSIVFKGSGGVGTLNLQGPTTPNASNYTLSIPAITGNDTVCTVTLNNCVGSGVTTVGTIDSQTASANGAVISGSSIYLQTATAAVPGLVSTTTQTFAGNKTFTGDIAVNGGDITSTGALVISTNSTARMTYGANGGILVANNTSQDEFEIGDDLFNINDTATRLNISNASDTSSIRLGQSTSNYGYLAWNYNSNVTLANLGLNATNSYVALQQSGGGVTVNGTTNPLSGVGLQIEASNMASINQTTFVNSAQSNYAIDIDSNANDTSSIFSITRDNSAATLLSIDQNAVVSVAGGQTKDITTASASAAAALALQPGDSTGSNGTGASASIKAGNATSTTCGTACTGGTLTLQGGSATGASGTTRNGGDLILNAGTGATANGTLTISNLTSTNTIAIGNANTATGATQTINIGAGTPAGTGKALVTIGNTANASSLTLQAGSIGISMLTTSNVTIGIVDSNGTLLVLDTKNNAGDPTGVDGAMYYNSSMAMMRCYYDSSWRFCNEPRSLSWGYNFQEDFINYDTTNPQQYIGSNNWIGNDNSGTTAAAVYHVTATIAGTAHPGVIRVDDGTQGISSAYASTYIGSDGFGSEPILLGGGEVIEMSVSLGTLSDATNEYLTRFGLCDKPNADCVDGTYFEYNRTNSTSWSLVTASNSSRTRIQNSNAACSAGSGSSVTVADSTWIRFKIVLNSNATQANYYINGTFVGCITTNIPTGAGRFTSPYFSVQKETGATATSSRYIDVDYFDMHNSFTTQR